MKIQVLHSKTLLMKTGRDQDLYKIAGRSNEAILTIITSYRSCSRLCELINLQIPGDEN